MAANGNNANNGGGGVAAAVGAAVGLLNNSHTTSVGPSTSSRPMSSCVTKVKPLKLNQRWTVENFNSVIKLSKPGICLRSQVFKHNTFQDACWQLCLYPGGKRDENANNVSLFLKMSATTPTKEVELKAEYRFFFLDDEDKPKFNNINIGEFHAKPPKGGHSWGLRNIPKQKVMNALREDGSLMILCEIEMIPDINKVRCISDKPVALASSDLVEVPKNFIDGQRMLLKQGILSDCEVEIRNQDLETTKVFPAHKAVLSAQSEVFRAMFGHDNLVEATENRVVIEDFSFEAVQAFLQYIYTGCAESLDLEERAEELMGLSEKYGLNHLKGYCQDFLVGHIDRSNVCQLVALADLYRAESLKQACVSFIRNKKADILDSDSWNELKERTPKLVNELLEQMLRTAEGLPQPPPLKRQRTSNNIASSTTFIASPPSFT